MVFKPKVFPLPTDIYYCLVRQGLLNFETTSAYFSIDNCIILSLDSNKSLANESLAKEMADASHSGVVSNSEFIIRAWFGESPSAISGILVPVICTMRDYNNIQSVS